MMNYAEILKQILKVETMENLYAGFSSECAEGTYVHIISTDELKEVLLSLTERRTTKYMMNDKGIYVSGIYISVEDMNYYQNHWYNIYKLDDDYQFLVGDSKTQLWLFPIFFKEFYEYCEEILDDIEPSPSGEKIKQNLEKKEDEEKMNISVNDFCDIAAKVLLNDMDMLNDLIVSMTDLGASNDQIVKTISTILKNHFND